VCNLHVEAVYEKGARRGSLHYVQTFEERLNDLNGFLLYFPEKLLEQWDQDEIIEISDQVKSPEWIEAIVSANNEFF
jgi:hypothetical protein